MSGNITAAGQRDQYTFQGGPGQEIELFGPEPSTAISSAVLTSPSGTSLYDLQTLTQAGTYTLTITGSQPGSYQFRLIDTADAPSLGANASVSGTLAFSGDEFAYTLAGTQGERVVLQGDTVVASLFDPSGNSVNPNNGVAVLPVTGTYLVLVNPSGN